VQVKATAFRDGAPEEIPLEEIVPGDVVALKAGDTFRGLRDPGSQRSFVNQAALTGKLFL